MTPYQTPNWVHGAARRLKSERQHSQISCNIHHRIILLLQSQPRSLRQTHDVPLYPYIKDYARSEDVQQCSEISQKLGLMRPLFRLPTTPIRHEAWALIVLKLTICPQLDRIRQTVRLGTKSGVSDAAPDIIIVLEDDKVVHGCICQGLLAKRGMVRRSISHGSRMARLDPVPQPRDFQDSSDLQRPQYQLCQRHYKAATARNRRLA